MILTEGITNICVIWPWRMIQNFLEESLKIDWFVCVSLCVCVFTHVYVSLYAQVYTLCKCRHQKMSLDDSEQMSQSGPEIRPLNISLLLRTSEVNTFQYIVNTACHLYFKVCNFSSSERYTLPLHVVCPQVLESEVETYLEDRDVHSTDTTIPRLCMWEHICMGILNALYFGVGVWVPREIYSGLKVSWSKK